MKSTYFTSIDYKYHSKSLNPFVSISRFLALLQPRTTYNKQQTLSDQLNQFFPSYLTDLPYKTASVSHAISQTTPLCFFKSKIIQQLISDLFGQIAFGTKIEFSYLQRILSVWLKGGRPKKS